MPGVVRRIFLNQKRLCSLTKPLLLVLLLTSPEVIAFSPEDALEIEPAAYEMSIARLELASIQDSLIAFGSSGWVQVDYTKDWSYRAGIGVTLDPVKQLEVKLNSARTRTLIRARKRAAIYQALSLHARLWQAKSDLEAARVNTEISRLNLEAVKVHDGGELALEDAKLAVEENRLKLEMAQNQLESAIAEARLMGFDGNAEPRTLQFELPPLRADSTSQIQYRLQEARRDRSWRGLFAIRTAAVYTGGDLDYRFEVRTAEPRFDFSLGPKFPFSQTGEWRFSLSVRLALDPIAWTQIRQNQLMLEETQTINEQKEEKRNLKIDYWRRQVALASKSLELARARSELAGKRLEQAKRRYALGLISKLESKKIELANLLAESQLAMAWAAYLRAVDGYLETADREWRIK